VIKIKHTTGKLNKKTFPVYNKNVRQELRKINIYFYQPIMKNIKMVDKTNLNFRIKD
jgi:hypothetical protein